MRLDQKSPVYRKIMVPWWDSEIACLIILVFMCPVFVFGTIGISVAYTTIEYRSSVWVPLLIAVLSAAVILSTSIRFILRCLTLDRNSQ